MGPLDYLASASAVLSIVACSLLVAGSFWILNNLGGLRPDGSLMALAFFCSFYGMGCGFPDRRKTDLQDVTFVTNYDRNLHPLCLQASNQHQPHSTTGLAGPDAMLMHRLSVSRCP